MDSMIIGTCVFQFSGKTQRVLVGMIVSCWVTL